jgi:hypothetical protein
LAVEEEMDGEVSKPDCWTIKPKSIDIPLYDGHAVGKDTVEAALCCILKLGHTGHKLDSLRKGR